MMKSMGNDDDDNNWLGFSLSPHMNMEVPCSDTRHQSHAPSPSVSNALEPNFFLPSSHMNFYGIEETSAGFCSHLSVMPLKSDGSLCIMEALRRSQQQEVVSSSTSTPKLEDFLGGAVMGTHQYGSNDKETMALSLDSLYYQPETNKPQSLHSLQQNSYFSGITDHEIYQTPFDEVSKDTQLEEIPPMAGEEILGLKNWDGRSYSSNQKMGSCLGDDGGVSGSFGAMGYCDLQPLSLSMSPGTQASCVTAPHQTSPAETECLAMETSKRKIGQKQPTHRKSIDTFGQRTSQYRGVTRHRWTGRYEAHLWDNSCKKEGQSRKGRQVYLGGYDMEEKAARAYDLAAIKYWGPYTHINFPLETYPSEVEEMKNMGRQEYVAHLRRKSSGFSRGASIYRGVTRHHQHGRWQARIGRVAGNKDLYLGTFSTQEEAAEAYDIAAIKFRGLTAVTNFDITRYDVERIIASNSLLSGELAKRNKEIKYSRNAVDQATLAEPTELADQMSIGMNLPLPSALPSLLGADTLNVPQQIDGSCKLVPHLSNDSSVIASPREGSPYKTGLLIPFAKTTPLTSWIPSPQMPVFAAWTDA